MNTEGTNPLHHVETEFNGELQVFSGPALPPDDPSLELRVRKGRPTEPKKRPTPEQKDTPATD